MQITEQIIERIARRTFNSMFAPALRQSNVVTGGAGSSVSWADNAGHATTADSATTADTASAAPWAGITDKPATATRWPKWSEVTDKPSTFAPSAHTHDYIVPKSNITYGSNYLQYDDVYATEASNPANAIGNPTADWYHHIVMNHANAGGYFVDMALCFHNNYFYYRRIANGVASDWVRVIDSSNISTQSVNYATSADSATKATQDGDGNTISSTYLKLDGGTMTGSIIPNTDNAIDLGSSTKRWRYIYSYGMWGKSGAALRLGGNDATLMYLTSDAKCGIGTDSPSQKLHVSGGLAAITNNSRTVTIGAQNSSGIHIYNDNSSPFFFNGDVSSNASKTYDLGSSTYPWGTLYAAGGAFYDTSPSVHVGTSSSARISLHWSSDSNRGIYDYSGYWVVATNGTNTFMMKGNVGIGTTAPAYKLDVNGVIYSNTGVYSAGYVTALSDARKKDVLGDVELSAEQIAEMPAVRFSWTDKTKPGIFIGTLAQPWQKLLPEAVRTMADGVLSFDYQSAAMVSVINLAREVAAIKSKLKRYGFK